MLATAPGLWQGTARLWLDPAQPAAESPIVAAINAAAGGGYLVIAYEWSHQGTPHDGVLSVRLRTEPAPIAMTWVDSFHQGGCWMLLAPEEAGGVLAGRGSYAAPPGPDWGWRIMVSMPAPDALCIEMENIWPEGRVDRAVEFVLARA